MLRRPRRLPLPTSASGASILSLAILAVPSWTEAVEVRAIAARSEAAATSIAIVGDGAFPSQTSWSAASGRFVVEIPASSLGERAARVLPVGDSRVAGVVATAASGSATVRVSVDLAAGVVGRMSSEGDRLMLRFSREPASSSPRATSRGPAEALARAPASARSVARPPSREPRRSPAAPEPAAARPLVVLDPGHGGKDPGAAAWTGEYEKDIVLDISRRVASRLRARGVDVVETRRGDEFVTLEDRRDASRRWGADAFVSIHANASPNAKTRGIETFYHSPSNDRDVLELAREENGRRRQRGRAGHPWPAATGAGRFVPAGDSARLARSVQRELVSQLGMRYEAVRDLGAKEGPFFVIERNAAPSVLVEAAFLTHREEGLRIRSELYRDQIAEGISRGILAFVDEQRRLGAL